jgi:hypothetical protein
MERSQIRQIVTAQFYQSLAENGTQIQSIPQSELQSIVNALADSVFAALAAVESEGDQPAQTIRGATPAAAAALDPEMPVDEQLLWRGRPYLSIGTVYEITTQRIRIMRGVLGNTVDEIELVRVRDTRVKQHMGERMLDVGDVTILSDDPSQPEFVLHNVSNPLEVRELIRKAMITEKERRGVRYREELN